jgi:putative transposase
VWGFDGGKLIKGRKRHLVVDTLGLVIGVIVTEGNASERVGALMVLAEAEDKVTELQLLWVDQGYRGQNFSEAVEQICGAKVEVIKRTQKEFEILPKRWIVERTFGWFNWYRRLSKDYELCPSTSEAMIYGSMIRLMLRRLTA